MRGILAALVACAAAVGAAPSAWTHAVLDHASPTVGSSVPASPPVVTLWFTQDLEPAFSGVTVTTEAGQRVDLGNAQIPQGNPAKLEIRWRGESTANSSLKWGFPAPGEKAAFQGGYGR